VKEKYLDNKIELEFQNMVLEKLEPVK